ncbi:MAG: tetratricopeptide repeat protein [candidate division KSB1 bacterium]|nr:tetratricopeptide repeat protein [candidate division KSB1 bacterium]
MTKTQKILGSSILSITLLAITFFSMCGIRMQRIHNEGDAIMAENSENQEQDDLLTTLELLEEGEGEQVNGELDTFDMSENTSGATATSTDAETFISPEAVQSLQAQISDLEKLFALKQRAADSLRHRAEEIQFSKVAKKGAEQTRKFLQEDPLFASKTSSTVLEPSATASTMVDRGLAATERTFVPAPPQPEDFSEFRMHYQDALDAYYARRYDIAIKKFRKLLVRADAGDLADNCQYWIGECYYAMGDYYQAVAEFEKVYAWSGSNKIGDAQLMVAISLLKAGEKQQARTEFSALLSFFQKQAAAQKARRYLDILEQA